MTTIHDIAREAQVSAMTVSRVITGSSPGKVSAQTRARVLRIAQELGYQPSISARALRSKSTFLFGLVVPSIDQSFTASVVEGIQALAMAKDYSCLLYITRGLPELEARSFEALMAKNTDGVIWVPGQRISPRIADLKAKMPVLQLLNKEVPDLPAVLVDQKHGQYLATSYLTQLGHRRVGYLMMNDRHSKERLIGHRQALKDAEIPLDDSHVLRLEQDWPHRTSGIRQFLQEQHDLTAIAASTDMTAWYAIQVAFQMGRRVPDDLSITGFDDIEIASQIIPALTTVDQPKRELGEAAMQLLTCCMDGEKVDDIVMQPRLIKRETTSSVQTN